MGGPHDSAHAIDPLRDALSAHVLWPPSSSLLENIAMRRADELLAEKTSDD